MVGKETKRISDNRFKLGFSAFILLIGIALILNYLTDGDLHLVLAVFCLGMAFILAFLALYVGERNFYLFGFSILLLFSGLVFTFSHPKSLHIDFGVFIGVFLILIVFLFLFYSFKIKEREGS